MQITGVFIAFSGLVLALAVIGAWGRELVTADGAGGPTNVMS
ncbi:hypothetical protein AB0G04_15075 [Actinoplanes sp. NPDC023801]